MLKTTKLEGNKQKFTQIKIVVKLYCKSQKKKNKSCANLIAEKSWISKLKQ